MCVVTGVIGLDDDLGQFTNELHTHPNINDGFEDLNKSGHVSPASRGITPRQSLHTILFGTQKKCQ